MKKNVFKSMTILALTAMLSVPFLGKENIYAADGMIDATQVITGSQTVSGTVKRADGFYGDMYVVKNGATLTIDATIDGNRDNVVKGSEAIVKVEAGGKLVINSGTLMNNADTAIVSHGGTVEMNGGNITNNGSLMKSEAVVTLGGATYTLTDECDLVGYPCEANFQTRKTMTSLGLDPDMDSATYMQYLFDQWANRVNAVYTAHDAGKNEVEVSAAAKLTKDSYLELKKWAEAAQSDFKLYGDWTGNTGVGCYDTGNFLSIENNVKVNPFSDMASVAVYEIQQNATTHIDVQRKGSVEFINTDVSYGGAISADNASVININGGTIGGTAEIDDSNYNELNVINGANRAAFGGAIYVSNSTLTVNGGTIQFNDTYFGKNSTFAPSYTESLSSVGQGGAIYAGENSIVNIAADVNILHNRAHSGGAVYAADQSVVTIGASTSGESNILIQDNQCTFGQGGAIAIAGGKVILNNGTIERNFANWPEIGTNDQANGGAIAMVSNGSDFEMNGGLIHNNISVSHGGGIAMLNAGESDTMTFTMNGGTLIDNTAVNSGKAINAFALGTELYVGNGNKAITLSGGSINNSDKGFEISDNGAIYVDNKNATSDINFIKLDGVALDGICYLTSANKVSLTAIENCRDDFKLRLNLSNDFVPGKEVVNGIKAKDLLKNSYITNPDGRELAVDDAGNLYILKVIDYSKDPNVSISGLTKADGTHYAYGEDYTPKLNGVTDTDSVDISYAEYSEGIDENYSEYIYRNEKPTIPGKYVVQINVKKTVTDSSGTYKTSGFIYQIYEISKLDIQVTIDNQSTQEGYAFAPLTMKISKGALQTGDTIEDLKAELTKAEGTAIGKYVITGKSTSDKYNVIFVNGEYTIKENAQKVKFLNDFKNILNEDKDTITLDKISKVQAAINAFDQLDEETKALLQNEDSHLNELKIALDLVQSEIQNYQDTYQDVINKEMKDTTLSDLDRINEAIDNYDQLSKRAQDQLHSEYKSLAALRDQIKGLQDAVDTFKNTHQSILSKDVASITNEDLASIDKALTDYAQLSEQEQKELSKEYALLLEMRNQIPEIEIVNPSDPEAPSDPEVPSDQANPSTQDSTAILSTFVMLLMSAGAIFVFRKKGLKQ